MLSTPIFQFAVFYNGDLEVHPGPDMTLGGRIHTNGNMHLGAGNTLTLDTNYVRAVGHLYRNRKDDPSTSGGTVKIRKWVVDPFDGSEPEEYVRLNSKSQMDDLGVPSLSGYDSRFVDGWDEELDGSFTGSDDWLPWVLGAPELWSQPDGYGTSGSTVQTAEHGTSELVAPQVVALDMFQPQAGGDYAWNATLKEYVPVAPGTGTHKKGNFHGSADLSIIGHRNGTWSAYDSYGNDVSSALAGAVSIVDFYDARQGGNVSVTQIDVGALNSSSAFPANGLVYASSYGMGEGTDLKGVKLVNGAELAQPLTVVTNGGAYVQGDYNTVDKKGASVIADAVNLLSNDWDDSKGPGTLPVASDTTFNLAFITGNQDTEEGSYNGGFENLPRFHEAWSGVDCNIRGSFVCLWTSIYATGAWKYGGDRYKAPRRNWDYDPAFNDIANLPPFTPMVVDAESVATW